MNPLLAQWLPVFMMVMAIWVGLIYNNKRLDDFKDLLRAEVGRAKAELHSEVEDLMRELRADRMAGEQRILQAVADLKSDIQALDRRVQRLEAPLLRG